MTTPAAEPPRPRRAAATTEAPASGETPASAPASAPVPVKPAALAKPSGSALTSGQAKPAAPAPKKAADPASPLVRYRKYLWQGKVFPAFWTITGVISLVVNVILIAILIGLGRYLFTLKNLINDQVIGGLHSNFVAMDDAHIRTTILVSDTIIVQDSIPVVFDLELNQDTTVVLTKDTSIGGTIIYLNGVAVPVPIVLPEGTPLDINLDLTVPVNKMIPVTLNVPVHLTVPVDIPLDQTELHEPFVGLRQVVEPYYGIMSGLPRTWEDTPLCGTLTTPLCRWFEK